MKKLIFLLTAVIWYGNTSAAGISSIDGPSSPCPNKKVKYTIDFAMLYNPPYVTETVKKVIWEFSQNGTVVHSYSKNVAFIGYFGTTSYEIPNGLPAGPIKIKVKIEYLILTMGSPVPIPASSSKTKEIYVGIETPESISGNNICPNSSGVFSVPSLTNATSYTWEVPAGWKVNGITGPVVTNQGAQVSITPCPLANGSPQSCETSLYNNYAIKAKGVSTSCGIGSYATKTITIDHPIRITETNLNYNDVRLSASPTNFPSYQWTLDPAWFFPANGNKNLPEVSFNSRGLTGLAKLTYKTPCQNTYTREWWWVLPNTGGPGSPGTPGEPQDPPGGCEPEIPVEYLTTAKSTNLIFLRDPCGEELPSAALYEYGSLKRVTLTKNNDGYEFDISNLKSGAYIMRLRTASGKHKTVKFIKLD